MGGQSTSTHDREPDADESGQRAAPMHFEGRAGDLIFSEGQLVLADGVIVQTYFVQLKKAQVLEWPDEPVLIRGCRTGHAIEHGARLRLSKPEAFRYDDEALIGDAGEGVTRREARQVHQVAVNHPGDMTSGRQRDAEHNALAGAIGSSRHRTTTGTRSETATTNRNTRTYGKNGWILCTSLRPADKVEQQQWRDSLDASYDHVTTIQSPRDFARALARMVVNQIAPRGGPLTYTHAFAKQRTLHPSQTVFHGPVAYVDDPYAYVASASNPFEVMLRSAFFKQSRFRYQREYRFIVWCEDEPDDLTVYLDVSQAMRNSLAILDEQPPESPPSRNDDQSSAQCVLANNDDAGAKPSAPRDDPERSSNREEPVTDTEEPDEPKSVDFYDQDGIVVPIPIAVAMGTAQVKARLRQLVLDADNDPQAAAAAFHAASALESLLATFVGPVSNVEWQDGGLIITLSMPPGSEKEGQLAFGPHGTGQYRIGTADEFEEVRCDQGWMLVQGLVRDLKRQGLMLWSHIPHQGLMIRPSEPRPASEPRVQSKYSAEIERMTIKSLDTFDEAEIDRINGLEPRSPNDARISKVVIDGGPGHIVKLHGIRDGLSGVITQRVKVNCVTITVGTINPDASVEIDPIDAHSEADGHQVALPEAKITSIKISATAPDGASKSYLDIVLDRSPEPKEQ